MRVVLAVILEVVAAALQYVVGDYVFSVEANRLPALRDKLHDSRWGVCDQAGGGARCPDWLRPWADAFPDKACLVTLGATIFLVVGAGVRRGRDSRVVLGLLTEFMLLHAACLILRATTVATTTLPAPSPLCRGATKPPDVGWFLFPVGCNDAMFSGHTCLYSICLVMWVCSYVPIWAKAAWGLWFAVCVFASAALRDHYTIDVLVAMYIALPIAWHRAGAIRRHMGVANDGDSGRRKED